VCILAHIQVLDCKVSSGDSRGADYAKATEMGVRKMLLYSEFILERNLNFTTYKYFVSSWYICPSQDNSAPPRLTYRHFPPTLLPSRSSTRPFQGLSCIHFTSSVDIPLSLFYFYHPPTAIGPFPAYRLPPPLTTSSLDTYITSIHLSLGLLILIPDDGGSTHL
jgi:hypothetical protein